MSASLDFPQNSQLSAREARRAHPLSTQAMLDVEYARFKDDTIRSIREDEEQYAQLQEQIHALEAAIEAETEARAVKTTATPTAPQIHVDAVEPLKDGKTTSLASQPAEPTSTDPTHLSTPVAQPQPSNVASGRIVPPSSPRTSDHGPTSEKEAFVAPSTMPHNARSFPSPAGRSPMQPPPELHPAHLMTPSSSGPGRGSPLPHLQQQQQQFQQYPPYNQPPNGWHLQQAVPYSQSPSPHPVQHFYQHGSPPHQGIPPMPVQYQHYPQQVPVNHYNRAQQQPRHMQMPLPMPYPLPAFQPASAGTTPKQRRDETPSRSRASGTSTPWKRMSSNLPGLRVPSPERPREVSPLSDTEPAAQVIDTPNTTTKTRGKPKKHDDAPQKALEARGTRRARAGSTASSTVDRESRSQSLASFASDSKPPLSNRGRGSKNIKPEPISTPVPFPSDSEMQRSSGRRRTRGETLTSHDAPARNTLKRKRDSVQGSSPIASSPPPSRPPRQRAPQDPNLVSVSKTFGRVASGLLQRITEHKYAGIFAKALSEREAPGYKTLVHRPQDLKSIKAAVNRGGKAAIAAIEELEQETGEVPTLIKVTEDLIPPKGIVNMDQLEKELMRMFANAIMFNPLPEAERGLGPRRSLRLSSRSSQAGELGYAGSEEGGIVQDAREMCEDVQALIQTFKAAEQDRMDVDHS